MDHNIPLFLLRLGGVTGFLFMGLSLYSHFNHQSGITRFTVKFLTMEIEVQTPIQAVTFGLMGLAAIVATMALGLALVKDVAFAPNKAEDAVEVFNEQPDHHIGG